MLTCVRVQNINTIRTSLGLVLVSWRARYVRKKKLLHATRHAHMCTRTKYQHDLNTFYKGCKYTTFFLLVIFARLNRYSACT